MTIEWNLVNLIVTLSWLHKPNRKHVLRMWCILLTLCRYIQMIWVNPYYDEKLPSQESLHNPLAVAIKKIIGELQGCGIMKWNFRWTRFGKLASIWSPPNFHYLRTTGIISAKWLSVRNSEAVHKINVFLTELQLQTIFLPFSRLSARSAWLAAMKSGQ